MNAGSHYWKAKRHAQANADRTREPWVLHYYGGTCWIHRLSTYTDGKPPEGAEVVQPRAREGAQP